MSALSSLSGLSGLSGVVDPDARPVLSLVNGASRSLPDFSRDSAASYAADVQTLLDYVPGDSLADASATFARTSAATLTGERICHVYAQNGQSNAIAYGTIGIAPPANIQAIDSSRVKIWNGSAFVGYVAGTTSEPNGVYPDAWGAEAEFARQWCLAYPSPEDELYIVKYAIGATQLEQGAPIDWHPDSEGEHFEGMETFMADGLAALAAIGKAPVVIANLWMQGEMDAATGHAAGAAAYQLNLAYLIAQARVRWQMPSAQFIIGRITYDDGSGNLATVRAAQEAVAATDAAISILDLDEYPTDGTHYLSAGVVTMGADAFAAYLAAAES